LDLVFIGRISTKDRPFQKLQADLNEALTEIKKSLKSGENSCDASAEL